MASTCLGLQLSSLAASGARPRLASCSAGISRSPLRIECAHKKGSGSTKNGRDSVSKRRGVKVYGGQDIKSGAIIVRQLGTKFHPGPNVGLGKDYTLYALQEGVVMFEKKQDKQLVCVYPPSHPKVVAKLAQPDNGKDHPSRRERRRQLYTPRAQQRQGETPTPALAQE